MHSRLVSIRGPTVSTFGYSRREKFVITCMRRLVMGKPVKTGTEKAKSRAGETQNHSTVFCLEHLGVAKQRSIAFRGAGRKSWFGDDSDQGAAATRASGKILEKGPPRAGRLRARKKRGAETAPRPIAQFSARRRFHPSFLASIRPPAPPQRAGEYSLPLGGAANVARNLRPEKSIAESGAPRGWPQQRFLLPTAKYNPGQRDRRAALSEFSAPSQPPPAQARAGTVGHIWFPHFLARRNIRFPRIALSRTTSTLRGPFLRALRENSIRQPLVSQPPPHSRGSPSPAPRSEADQS